MEEEGTEAEERERESGVRVRAEEGRFFFIAQPLNTSCSAYKETQQPLTPRARTHTTSKLVVQLISRSTKYTVKR